VGDVGAAASTSILVGVIIFTTAHLFVDFTVQQPLWAAAFLVMTCVTFALFGFIIGVWADNFQRLQLIPVMVVMPLAFLGGTFYSIDMLPPFWRGVALFNPVLYLVSGFRWSFYGIADVSPFISLAMTAVFMLICLAIVYRIFKTGYRLKV
jgi:ABC-2 type transport system permease protein